MTAANTNLHKSLNKMMFDAPILKGKDEITTLEVKRDKGEGQVPEPMSLYTYMLTELAQDPGRKEELNRLKLLNNARDKPREFIKYLSKIHHAENIEKALNIRRKNRNERAKAARSRANVPK